MNTFAKETEGKPIKNICIGNDRWIFTNIFGMENFFLVAQLPIPTDKYAKFLDLTVSEKFLSEILMEFTKRYSSDTITEYVNKLSFFDEMGNWANQKLEQYYKMLDRSKKCDPIWLAKFTESEKLFTAILANLPMFVINDQEHPTELEKFQSTIEVLRHDQIFQKANIDSLETLKIHKINPLNTIYIMNRMVEPALLDLSGVLVDLISQKVIKGPDSDPFALKLTTDLRNLSQGDDQKIWESLLKLAKVENDFLDISIESKEKPGQAGLTFRCNICNGILRFEQNDPTTYFNKKRHEKFLGMELTSYQVGHLVKGEMHVNTVIIDDSGVLQGIVESHTISLASALLPENETFSIVPTNYLIKSHKTIEILYLLDLDKYQIIDIISPASLNIIEIAKISLERMKEIQKIYQKVNNKLNLTIGDKKYYVWISGKTAFICCLQADHIANIIEVLATGLLKYSFNEIVLKLNRIFPAIMMFEKNKLTVKDVDAFFRLISDDRLYSRIQVKYPENIPRIIRRLSQEFNETTITLEPLLKSELSIDDILKSENYTKTREFLELIDYIDRRGLLN